MLFRSDAWDESIPGFDHVLGMHSFGLNETGHYSVAETVGREAVARNGEDLWSVHAVAHALEMQGDLAAGDRLFDVDPTRWDSKNPFRGHMWWHAALFAWNGGDYERVLRIFDERLRPVSTDFYLDIQNLSSILTRLELVGVDVGDRWDAVADHAAARVGDHVLAFTDVHCALTLARTGRHEDLEAFTTSLIDHRSARPATADTSGVDAAIQLSLCFAADAAGDPTKAAVGMRAIRGDLAPIGGSHAQRDLFDLLTADDIRAGLLKGYDLLFVPGGWASDKMAALGEDGAKAVRTFIEGGGGYLGFCGGAGLALTHDSGLGLLPVRRLPTGKRLPSFSGTIRLHLHGGDHPVWSGVEDGQTFHAWWPGQFSPPGDDSVQVLAEYGDPGLDAFVTDLPVRDGTDWQAWEENYGINLDPGRIRGEPALIESDRKSVV